jgi:hypothetical protein
VGDEAYTAKEAGREDPAPKTVQIAMPTPLGERKAALGRPCMARAVGVAGVPSPGHASKGIPQEPKRAPHLLPHREERLSHREVRDPKGDRRDTEGCRAVLRTHSTDESGEPQGFRKERPRNPLEGRGKQADVSAEGNIDETQNSILYVHETRQNS